MTRQPNTPRTEAEIAAYTIGDVHHNDGPITICDYDPAWPGLYAEQAARIRDLLGDVAIRLEHVGSTSVPLLAAKPIIDMVLEVPDSTDEDSYVGPLESAGYRLRVREPGWFQHRMLKGPDTDINLHVFSAGCAEVGRMIRFRDHLRGHPADRELYQRCKRELASRQWQFVQNYADAKTDVIEQIIARASR